MLKSLKKPRPFVIPHQNTAYLNRSEKIQRYIHDRPRRSEVILPNQIYEQRRSHVEYVIPHLFISEPSPPSSLIGLLRSLFSAGW